MNSQLLKIIVLTNIPSLLLLVEIGSTTSLTLLDDTVCGVVNLKSGQSVELTEDFPISDENFEKMHTGKLTGATFKPTENCAVNICGFASLGIPLHEGYIGTSSDYADCAQFTNRTTTDNSLYNAKFNLSSVTCGCFTGDQACVSDCEPRNAVAKWTGLECAVLYPEKSCSTCYLPPIKLLIGETFVTSNAVQILSLIIRQNCVVKHKVPAIHHIWRSHLDKQPYVYTPPFVDTTETSFQSSPETFSCECQRPPAKPTDPPSQKSSFGGATIASFVFVICSTVAISSMVLWKKLQNIRVQCFGAERNGLISNHEESYGSTLDGVDSA